MSNIILNIFLFIFQTIDIVMAYLFFFVPPLLRMFSLSLVILTIGVVLDSLDRFQFKVLKWLFYVFFIIYSIYTIGVVDNLMVLDAFDISIIMFGIIAPICMFIVGRQLSNVRVKGYKIFNYYTLWVIYMVIVTLWELFRPGDIYYGFVWIFFLVNIIILYYYLAKTGDGGSNVE